MSNASSAISSADRPGLIVSLTSFPARIDQAWIPIERTLRGDLTPDLVVLVLAEDEFPGRVLPSPILRLARRGLQVASLPGRWNESVAGHVDEGEDYHQAAEREAEEELGIAGVEIKEVARFKSEETDEPEKKKRRFTAVYAMAYDGPLRPSAREVAETRWISPADLERWIDRAPNDFTEGCILGFRELVAHGVVKA